MIHRNRVIGAFLVTFLLVAAPALAGTKSGRIHAARLHRVTQITSGDVALARNPVTGRDRSARVARIDYGRQVLIPNTDAQRQVLLPSPDAQRQVVLPNPDAQRQVLLPNPDAQRQVLLPNPDAQRQVLVPNPDGQ